MARVGRNLSGLGSLVLLCLAGPARGEDSDASKLRAAELLDTGNQALAAKRYEEAANAYSEAYALYPSPKILLNLAQAEHASGRPDQAAGHYEDYLERVRVQDPQRQKAASRLEQLQKELGRLVFEGGAQDTTLQINGSAPMPLPTPHLYVIPGQHELRLERPGFEPLLLNITVDAGRRLPIRATLAPAVTTSAPPPPMALPTPPPSPPPALVAQTPAAEKEESSSTWWIWVVAGVAVAGGVVAAVVLTSGGDDFVPGGELGRSTTASWERVSGQ